MRVARTAAHNSRRGIDCILIGATLFFDATKLTLNELSDNFHRKYIQVPKASSEAS